MSWICRLGPAALLMCVQSVGAWDPPDPFATENRVPSSQEKDLVPAAKAGMPCVFEALGSPLGLVETVERALCNNPQTRKAWANARAQAAQLGISEASYLPTLNGTLTDNNVHLRTTVDGFPSFDVNAHTRPFIRNITLAYVLYDFGLRSANMENGEQQLIAANANHDVALQTVFMAAVQAFYDTQAAEGALQSALDAENTAKGSWQAAQARYEARVSTLADKLQAQTAYSQAILNRIQADGNLKSALGTLAIAMGLSASTPINLEKAGAPLPGTEFVRSVEVLIAEALQDHPTLAAARAQLEASRAQAKSALAAGLPTISLAATHLANTQYLAQPGTTLTTTNTVGISLTVPLFEGFNRVYQVRSAQAQVQVSEANLASSELQVTLDVWTAYQTLTTATESLKSTADLLESARESFRVAQGRYKARVGDILELLNAQTALASADQQRVQALSNWHTARLKLLQSLGRLGFWAISPP